MLLTINSVYVTGYTAPMIELSKGLCRGSVFLERVEWFYTDIIEVDRGVYAFAGPIGVPLILSPFACFLDRPADLLLVGGIIMSLSTTASMVFTLLALREVYDRRFSYAVTSTLMASLASMPWVYSSHLFPQALLTMCYPALLYFTSRLILEEGMRLRLVVLHAAFSSVAFLADPSSALLIAAIAALILMEKWGLLVRNRVMFSISASFWLTTVVMLTLPQLYYNFVTTGNPLLFPELVYSQMRGLGTGFDVFRIPVGLAVQLIDLRKSLLSLYPASFISLVYVPKVVRHFKRRSLGALYISMILIPLLTYSSWHDYHGGLSFGPRFLAPVTQILALPLLLLLNSGGLLPKLVLALSLYSTLENTIVLVSTPYPCAFQQLSIAENQLYACSLRRFLGGTSSALVTILISKIGSLGPLETNLVSAGVIFSLASLAIMLSYVKRI